MHAMVDRGRIRFGGKDTPEGFLFELTGGNLALDLANTLVSRRSNQPRELLLRYPDLVNWCCQVGLVDEAEASELLANAAHSPRPAARALRQAIVLRETVNLIFGLDGPDESSLRKLQDYAEKLSSHRQLVRDGNAITWRWKRQGLDWMLWPIVHAAAELLTSDARDQVRVCAADTCGWLFIDNSRRRNRRWCDMTVCGNRAKARRHHAMLASRA
jgi:predicted RNA-binding Zn ribbon-like protein